MDGWGRGGRLWWEIKEYGWGGSLWLEREVLGERLEGGATDPRASVQRAPAIAPSSAVASAVHPVAPISLLLLGRVVLPKLKHGRRSQSSLTPSQSLSPRSYVAESQYVPLPVAARISVCVFPALSVSLRLPFPLPYSRPLMCSAKSPCLCICLSLLRPCPCHRPRHRRRPSVYLAL